MDRIPIQINNFGQKKKCRLDNNCTQVNIHLKLFRVNILPSKSEKLMAPIIVIEADVTTG